jgi:hypothetical protein
VYGERGLRASSFGCVGLTPDRRTHMQVMLAGLLWMDQPRAAIQHSLEVQGLQGAAFGCMLRQNLVQPWSLSLTGPLWLQQHIAAAVCCLWTGPQPGGPRSFHLFCAAMIPAEQSSVVRCVWSNSSTLQWPHLWGGHSLDFSKRGVFVEWGLSTRKQPSAACGVLGLPAAHDVSSTFNTIVEK